jgi:very-short-patch-repair endonuclease
MSGGPEQRVEHLLNFLQAYHAQKNPPVHDIGNYKLELIRAGDLPEAKGIRLSASGERWLSVDFVELPARPQIPVDLVPLLGASANLTAGRRPEVELRSGATDDERRDAARAEEWVSSTWAPWSEAYLEADTVKDLYQRLFRVRERMATDRDAVEFVWGFGRLIWSPAPGVLVDHPLLTFPVEVEIDQSTNGLSVRPAGALTVESVFLSDIAIDDQVAFNAIRATLEALDEPLDPWDDELMAELVRRIVRCIDHDGILEDRLTRAQAGAEARVDTSWMLFLRRRNPDYQGFLELMRDLYRDGVEPPASLRAVVMDEPSLLVVDGSGEPSPDNAERLLLPLPSNEEQQRIVSTIRRRPGVTVKGPPGTGKSHTIANIVSHYLAYGRRVLVVAEKEQALSVLAEKIPASIRHLTVSVLGADEQGRRRLESTIDNIQDHVTGLDRELADDQITRLTTELDGKDREIAEITGKLLASRQIEAQELAGRWGELASPTPSAAADYVACHAAELGYIPDSISTDCPPPITVAELTEFAELVRQVGAERAEALALEIPPLALLPTGAQLDDLFAQLDAAAADIDSARPELVDPSLLDAAEPAKVAALATEIANEQAWMVKQAGTWLARVQEHLGDDQLAADWPRFLGDVYAAREEILSLGYELEAHDVALPQPPPSGFDVALLDARDRFKSKGKLGLFAGGAKAAVEACRVDGRVPASAAAAELCLQALRRSNLRRELITRWSNRMVRVSGPPLDAERPEDSVGPVLEGLRSAVTATERWGRIRTDVLALGIACPISPSIDELARLVQVLGVALRRQDALEAKAQVDNLVASLHSGASGQEASPLWALLLDDLTHRRTTAWDSRRAECSDWQEIAPKALRLRVLRDRLHGVAPVWTAAILSDPALAGNPSLLTAAWQWKQLDGWVRAISAGPEPADLQQKLEELSVERRRLVSGLVAQRAWRRLADNLGDAQRSALSSYLYASKRFGKTGGKFAARWIAEMRKALNESKDAVPVWIMTTNRALTSFRPSATPPFDLLIIDEASQIGLEALPLLSLAKSTIIVGDDKQTSPENVGVDRSRYFELLDRHLISIPKYRTLFDLDASLYDLAYQKFPGEIMLTEHFRSLPSIIDFSNTHVYDKRIVPLRDKPPRPGWKSVGAIKVEDGYRSGSINIPEAEVVVDRIAAMCGDPAYDDMDFGVVSLLGAEQSNHIWTRLLERLGPEVMAKRRIRCGEPANFQGDERDVVVLSLVAATDPHNPTARIGAMTTAAAVRRINVAVSRARNQLWVVHSVDPDRFPAGDLRAALIRHCWNPGAPDDTIDRLEDSCDSDFERQVLRRIIRRGYSAVRTQYEVGRYRIDLVVEGPHSRLAIECDGDRWHGEEVWHRDYARQQVLERAGWTFQRIRGSSFYRDPEAALEPLWLRLSELGIPTGDDWRETGQKSTVRSPSPALSPKAAAPGDRPMSTKEADLSEHDPAIDRDVAIDLPSARLPPDQPDSPRPEPPPGDLPTHGGFAEDPREILLPFSSRGAHPDRASAVRDVGPAAGGTLLPETFGLLLAPYRKWAPRALRPVSEARMEDLVDALAEIVSDEGPIHALQAYRLYVNASGGGRVGKETRQLLNRAAYQGVRTGRLAQIQDSVPGQADKTLYVPGQHPVVLRELGGRALTDVPRSEVALLMERLGTAKDSASLYRSVLSTYGLTRLTDRAKAYLDECQRYTWKV